ncbi:unnamed protein product, partial [marine sediment metagenome]
MVTLKVSYESVRKKFIVPLIVSVFFIFAGSTYENVSTLSTINYNLLNEETINSFGSIVDAYADEVVLDFTIFTSDGINSIGAPDGIYAQIFSDYLDGSLTLDMGRYEAIINDEGDDFI